MIKKILIGVLSTLFGMVFLFSIYNLVKYLVYYSIPKISENYTVPFEKRYTERDPFDISLIHELIKDNVWQKHKMIIILDDTKADITQDGLSHTAALLYYKLYPHRPRILIKIKKGEYCWYDSDFRTGKSTFIHNHYVKAIDNHDEFFNFYRFVILYPASSMRDLKFPKRKFKILFDKNDIIGYERIHK